jgi:hypothetical protein
MSRSWFGSVATFAISAVVVINDDSDLVRRHLVLVLCTWSGMMRSLCVFGAASELTGIAVSLQVRTLPHVLLALRDDLDFVVEVVHLAALTNVVVHFVTIRG